jgi:hypothetical protein
MKFALQITTKFRLDNILNEVWTLNHNLVQTCAIFWMKFRLYINDQVQNLQIFWMPFRLYYDNNNVQMFTIIQMKFRVYNKLDGSSDFTIS